METPGPISRGSPGHLQLTAATQLCQLGLPDLLILAGKPDGFLMQSIHWARWTGSGNEPRPSGRAGGSSGMVLVCYPQGLTALLRHSSEATIQTWA